MEGFFRPYKTQTAKLLCAFVSAVNPLYLTIKTIRTERRATMITMVMSMKMKRTLLRIVMRWGPASWRVASSMFFSLKRLEGVW